jgi:hypothetical protein
METDHPYSDLQTFQYWRSAVTDLPPGSFDPVVTTKFKISHNDGIATIGSCFAQHLARFIRSSGLNYLNFEPNVTSAPTQTVEPSAADFSARYGNVYSVRQALQLLLRSEGWEPKDSIWERHGCYFDAFRPSVFPEGFQSKAELLSERSKHLKACWSLFRTCDVVVFTLGLTESWMSTIDGAIYPTAPGVIAGQFDRSKYRFVNFTVSQTLADLSSFCAHLQSINSKVRIILTVSPVALNATYETSNCLVSSTYSKAVLRAAAAEIANQYSFVEYFPSYEIVNNPQNHGRYFEDDLRQVSPIAVQHVMRVFAHHWLSSSPTDFKAITNAKNSTYEHEKIGEIICDEDLLDT